MRIAAQVTVRRVMPHQTSARRCVMVRAMKSLMRMSCASVLQPRRLYNAWLATCQPERAECSRSPLASCASANGWSASPKGEREHSARSRRHAAGLTLSKAEQKSLAAADVSQRLLIRRAKELIAQPEPATQLLRRLCHRTEPMLTCEVCMKFGKGRILPKRQQCDARTFRER